jgi:hypothetical protein
MVEKETSLKQAANRENLDLVHSLFFNIFHLFTSVLFSLLGTKNDENGEKNKTLDVISGNFQIIKIPYRPLF